MGGWQRDVRPALRTMAARPGFTVLAVLLLALGVGSATAIFSVVHGVLLSALPYRHPDRILRLHAENTEDGDRATLRVRELRALEDGARSLERVGSIFPFDLTYLDGEGAAHRVAGAMISSGYFPVFGTRPARGRLFTPEEVASASARVVIVSHEFSRTELAGRNAIGSAITLDEQPFTVVGVLPADHRPPVGEPDLYVPYTLGTEGWIGRWLHTFATLAPGATAAAAVSQMNGLVAAIGETESRSRGWRIVGVSLAEDLLGGVRAAVWLLGAAVSLVLLIACANVANLLLARASTREREIGVRLALGATRREVTRQMLVESLGLAAVGGLAGLALAYAGVPALVAAAPPDLPRIEDVSVNGTVLAVALVLTALSGVLAGALPAFYATRAYPAAALGAGSRGATRSRGLQRLLGGFVVAEIALTVALLMTAGLVVRSFSAVLDQDPGFSDESTVAMMLTPPRSRYEEAAHVRQYFDAVSERVSAVSGVEAVGVGSHLPLSGRAAWMAVNSRERWAAGTPTRIPALQRVVAPSFFAALEIPLRAGRLFDSRDGPDAPERVIVNETLARRLWPGVDAVGRRLSTARTPDEDSWIEVIGVVGDVRYQTMEGDPEPQVYQPHARAGWRSMILFARGTGDADRLGADVRQAVRTFDPAVPISHETTLAALREEAVAARRFSVWLFGLFGIVALVLSLGGVYGVLSFAVSQRQRELGIRLALGAGNAALLALVFRRALLWLGAGLAGGLLLAFAASRGIRSQLFGVTAGDPLTWAGVLAALTLAVAAATVIPARRASRVDPMVVLREE